MPIIRPEKFRDLDLTLDVRLETCVNDIGIDFTGKKSYNFGLFKQSIGFGITDIQIEVNPSLQPIVDITFKDLYGNTLFGTQRIGGTLNNSEGTPNQPTEIDYSALYNWPPPKFYFTFKGYLGQPVTWILNLKKLTTGYDSSDSSYTLKASFVPNQWGIFADIPFLYLFGVKGLKQGSVGSNSDRVETIFDLIKIGKTVDVKRVEFTKQFDTLRNQTSSVYSNILNAINSSKLITSKTIIDGNVNNQQIEGFTPFSVTQPTWLTQDKISSITTTAEGIDTLNAFLVNKCLAIQGGQLALPISETDASISEQQYELFKGVFSTNTTNNNASNDLQKQYIQQNNIKLQTINNNLSLIEKATQEDFIEKNSKELGSLVISEVFKKLAGDTAYLVGKILEAGIKGYNNNSETRSNSSEIKGRSFPLIFKADKENGGNSGVELPATRANGAEIDYGVETNEMAFVESFIKAVSEGIAENKDFESAGSDVNNDDTRLITRVNNLEMLQSNPYIAEFKSIAGNLLLRSAIIGYITRSNDPNQPGDYGNATPIDNDSVDNIAQLAKEDIKNISIKKLADLKNIDQISLKVFCEMITSLFLPSGELNPNANGEEDVQQTAGLFQSSPDQELSNELKNFRFRYTDENGNVNTKTVNDFMFSPNLMSVKNILSSSNPEMASSEDFNKYAVSSRFYHNNLPWLIPTQSSVNKYVMILFEGTDASNVQNIQSSKTDQKYSTQTDEEKDDTDTILNGSIHVQPLGVIPINSFGEKDNNGVLQKAGRIKNFEKFLNPPSFFNQLSNPKSLLIFSPLAFVSFVDLTNNKYGGAISYNKIKTNPQESVSFSTTNEYKVNSNYFFVNYKSTNPQSLSDVVKINDFEIVDSSQQLSENKIPARDLAYTIYTHSFGDTVFTNLAGIVWGLFIGDSSGDNSGPGRGQRVALYNMCNELKNKVNELQTKKSQAVSDILGRATEQKNEIYKQFHNIFSQWNLLAFQDLQDYDFSTGKNNFCSLSNADEDIATRLEEQYGGSHINLEEFSTNSPSGTFLYDYPLNFIQGKNTTEKVDVSQAIINIDPLYSPDARTSVLNIIQQICQKNNFMFIPIPGNGEYRNIKGIYSPVPNVDKIRIGNYFHVIFMPTPESRVYGNDQKTPKGLDKTSTAKITNFDVDAIGIAFGNVDNQVVKGLNVNLDDNKPTAESIVNLQRLVSSENKNKLITKDCSTLPVIQGRSYTASLDMIGNAQIFPMQFFFIENSPIFSGLYQIMKVKHSIIPNDMTTTIEGIRLAFSPSDGYGGIPPIVLNRKKDRILKQSNVPLGSPGTSQSNIITTRNPNTPSTGTPTSQTKSGYVSKYVTLEKAIFSSRNASLNNDNIPNDTELSNMKYVAQNIYDKLVEHFGEKSIKINSFFRNEILNNAVGGSPKSWHRLGSAIDIGATGNGSVTNAQIYYYILRNLSFTELIWEYGTNSNPDWVHVAFNPTAGHRGNQGVKRISDSGTSTFGNQKPNIPLKL